MSQAEINENQDAVRLVNISARSKETNSAEFWDRIISHLEFYNPLKLQSSVKIEKRCF